jgi:hypothetical protein
VGIGVGAGVEECVGVSVGAGQEAKYVESWPNTTSSWAGWSRFDIPVDRSDGVYSLLLCTSSTLDSLPANRLASRKILIEQNIKKQTGSALCGRRCLNMYSVQYSSMWV